MKHLAVAGLLGLCLSGQASAQFVLGVRSVGVGIPIGYPRAPIFVGRGVVANYYSVTSFYPPPYYSPPPPITLPQNITINNFYGSSPILGPGYDTDVRGVDLDRFPVNKPKLADKTDAKPKQPENAPAKPLPGVNVSKAFPPVRPDQPAAKKPPSDPMDELSRLTDLGLTAFRAGENGLAAQRFRQAVKITPTSAHAWFLLSQAEIASGNYREAVEAIQAGMKIDIIWPRAPHQPRFELYKEREKDFADHLRRLTDAVAANPDNPILLFLVAHQLWFDGQRKDAVTLFHRARPLSKTVVFIDAFLAAGAGL